MRQDILLVAMLVLGILALSCLVRGFLAYLRWSDRRFARQLDADFRAYCIVQEARRGVARRA